MPPPPSLCGVDGCRRLASHNGAHDPYPTEAWRFFAEKDRNKINKAGFATPRGGDKGAYQNHVVRSNKVIIPFERLKEANLHLYADGWVVRLFPEQYFASAGKPKAEFLRDNASIVIGKNAFILYRTYESLERYPPMAGWEVRSLSRGDVPVTERGPQVVDSGHFVLRVASIGGARLERRDGPPQGIFAPEYANDQQNFLAKCVLAWLIVTSHASPYITGQAIHLQLILEGAGLANFDSYELRGVLRHGLTTCPLCLRVVRYEQLHTLVRFDEEVGLVNAAAQVEGATRSTEVNLFHLIPLVYGSLQHVPESIAWGHANCNTRLGQRRCYSLNDLQRMNLKVGILREEGIETIGWISDDYQMIRSPLGAVWVQLSGDMTESEMEGVPGRPATPEDEILGIDKPPE
jgi:hypothetical protein